MESESNVFLVNSICKHLWWWWCLGGGGGLSLAFTRTGSFLVIFTVHCTVKSCEGISFLFSPEIPPPPSKKKQKKLWISFRKFSPAEK